MAQKGWFEVFKLEFNFYSTRDKEERIKFVSDAMKKYLTRYASGTNYKISYELNDVHGSNVKIIIEFSKSISVNTVNKLLSKMMINNIDKIIYIPSNKEVSISVAG